MKIKNGDIELINTLLTKELTLSAKESRLRSRFLRKILNHYRDNYVLERTEIIKHFAIKDDNNEPIGQGTSYEIAKENLFPCQVQLDELDNEYFEIEDDLLMMESIYNIITTDDFKVEGELAIVHDELCEELESILEK